LERDYPAATAGYSGPLSSGASACARRPAADSPQYPSGEPAVKPLHSPFARLAGQFQAFGRARAFPFHFATFNREPDSGIDPVSASGFSGFEALSGFSPGLFA